MVAFTTNIANFGNCCLTVLLLTIRLLRRDLQKDKKKIAESDVLCFKKTRVYRGNDLSGIREQLHGFEIHLNITGEKLDFLFLRRYKLLAINRFLDYEF